MTCRLYRAPPSCRVKPERRPLMGTAVPSFAETIGAGADGALKMGVPRMLKAQGEPERALDVCIAHMQVKISSCRNRWLSHSLCVDHSRCCPALTAGTVHERLFRASAAWAEQQCASAGLVIAHPGREEECCKSLGHHCHVDIVRARYDWLKIANRVAIYTHTVRTL